MVTGRPFLRHLLILALAALTVAPAVSHADSQGGYTHGQLRKADREVYYCHERHVAVYMARHYNSVFADGFSEAKLANSGIHVDRKQLRKSGQCAVAKKIDHTSLETIYTAPAGNVFKRHVVKSRMVHSYGYVRINYVITGEAVPPCTGGCGLLPR